MDNKGRDFFLDYYWQRRIVGLIGFVLPIILSVRGFLEFGAIEWPSSISAYAYTHADVFLTAGMGAVGVFLLAYRGPDGEDKLFGIVAGTGALLVAIFQTGVPDHLSDQARCNVEQPLGSGTFEVAVQCLPVWTWDVPVLGPVHELLHFGGAGLFLVSLALLCLCRFVRTDDKGEGLKNPRKRNRNAVYRWCGWTMLAMLLLILADKPLKGLLGFDWPSSVFWYETIAVWAFSLSWTVKGELFLSDKPGNSTAGG